VVDQVAPGVLEGAGHDLPVKVDRQQLQTPMDRLRRATASTQRALCSCCAEYVS